MDWNQEQAQHSDLHDRVDGVRQIIAAGDNGAGAVKTAEHLARLLHDDEHAVRITAAHGLIALKAHAVRPTLEALARDVQSARLRAAAHHILLALYELGSLDADETRVLHALESPDPAVNAARALPYALRVQSQN